MWLSEYTNDIKENSNINKRIRHGREKRKDKTGLLKENTGKSQLLSLACGGLIPQDEKEKAKGHREVTREGEMSKKIYSICLNAIDRFFPIPKLKQSSTHTLFVGRKGVESGIQSIKR